ncbi:hypothetical protein C4579_00480 [Candidatus Microgenomates bacterium]|nr:MAG: hypothetical protein C4579_00480 [Candidatus Microgenomates bacterium]
MESKGDLQKLLNMPVTDRVHYLLQQGVTGITSGFPAKNAHELLALVMELQGEQVENAALIGLQALGEDETSVYLFSGDVGPAAISGRIRDRFAGDTVVFATTLGGISHEEDPKTTNIKLTQPSGEQFFISLPHTSYPNLPGIQRGLNELGKMFNTQKMPGVEFIARSGI